MTMSLWVYAWLLPCAVAYFILSWVRRWIKIDQLGKRHILITGADSGFGNLLTQRLDMAGCHVYAACESDAAKSRLQQFTSTRCKSLVMDPSVDEEVKQALDLVKQSLPENEGLWGLVNNASTYGRAIGPVEWLTHTDFQRVLDTGALGSLRVTLAFLPLLKKAKGRIVNLSSAAGRLASPIALPYSMSMAALENFSDGLRVYMAQYDVTVHLVEPVLFRVDATERLRVNKAVDAAWKGAPWYVKEEFGEDYYKELLNTVGRLANIEPSTPHLNKVVKAYMHALTARAPRTRYSVGWDACLLTIPLSYMPSLVTDYFMGRSHMPKATMRNS